jgi:peptide chain release factor 2
MDNIAERVQKLLAKVNFEDKKKQVDVLQNASMQAGFWDDPKSAGEKMKEMAKVQKEVEEMELLALWVEEGEIKEAETLLDKLETLLYFSTPYDSGSAILSIHSGQGGTEASRSRT